MTENDTHEPDDGSIETDGGTVAGGAPAAQVHRETDYLEHEVNILRPGTPYMRDHLRIIWTGFAVWVAVVFGPVTLTALAPDLMTTQMPVLGFPLHYFLIAIGGPTGGLILSFWYVRKRDQLDEKYGIEHGVPEDGTEGTGGAAAADGGEPE